MGKYEEALERARAGMPLDKVFPDLYESEDERIICNIKKAAELYWSDEPLNEILSWLEKQKEQKPAEWSEEDEFFRQQLIVYCDNCVQDSLAAKCVDWLKSLRPQPKREWGDEDRKTLDAIIKRYSFSAESDFSVFVGEDKLVEMKKEFEWLRNLQYKCTWKPSEDQLEVLKLVAEKDGTCLMGLYNELKTL